LEEQDHSAAVFEKEENFLKPLGFEKEENFLKPLGEDWLNGCSEDDDVLEELSPDEDTEDTFTSTEDGEETIRNEAVKKPVKKQKKPRNRPSKKTRQRKPLRKKNVPHQKVQKEPAEVSKRSRETKPKHSAQKNTRVTVHTNKHREVVIKLKATADHNRTACPNKHNRTKKRNKQRSPPTNVCWDWKQNGFCKMGSRRHLKQFNHDKEWKNYYKRR